MGALILGLILAISTFCAADDVRLLDLPPEEAQQHIESKDQTLKYAPKIDTNVPAVRHIGNDPQNVLEDIYLANQYHGQDGLGGYLYGYSVPDIAKTEKKQAGGDLRGAYQYLNDEGKEIKVEYWDDGTGFHQVDNVAEVAPQQVEDAPDVKAAKEEFFRRWHEEAERNSKLPDPNSVGTASPYQYGASGQPNHLGQASIQHSQYQPNEIGQSQHSGQGQYQQSGSSGYPSGAQPIHHLSGQGQGGISANIQTYGQSSSNGLGAGNPSGGAGAQGHGQTHGSFGSSGSLQTHGSSSSNSQFNSPASTGYPSGTPQFGSSGPTAQLGAGSSGYPSGASSASLIHGASASSNSQFSSGHPSGNPSATASSQFSSTSSGYPSGAPQSSLSHGGSTGYPSGGSSNSASQFGNPTLPGYPSGGSQHGSSSSSQFGSSNYPSGGSQASSQHQGQNQGPSASQFGNPTSPGYPSGGSQSSLSHGSSSSSQFGSSNYPSGGNQASSQHQGQNQGPSNLQFTSSEHSSSSGVSVNGGYPTQHGSSPSFSNFGASGGFGGQVSSCGQLGQPCGSSSSDGKQFGSSGSQGPAGQSQNYGQNQGAGSNQGFGQNHGFAQSGSKNLHNTYIPPSSSSPQGQNYEYSGQQTQNTQIYAQKDGGWKDGSDGSNNSGGWKDESGGWKDGGEGEQGPPRGFFYNFDYPVGIITQKQGSAKGGSYKREALQGIYQQNKEEFEQLIRSGAGVGRSYQVHA